MTDKINKLSFNYQEKCKIVKKSKCYFSLINSYNLTHQALSRRVHELDFFWSTDYTDYLGLLICLYYFNFIFKEFRVNP